MSQTKSRRNARRNKHARTHHVDSDELLCAMIIEHAEQYLHDNPPVPSDQVPAADKEL